MVGLDIFHFKYPEHMHMLVHCAVLPKVVGAFIVGRDGHTMWN